MKKYSHNNVPIRYQGLELIKFKFLLQYSSLIRKGDSYQISLIHSEVVLQSVSVAQLYFCKENRKCCFQFHLYSECQINFLKIRWQCLVKIQQMKFLYKQSLQSKPFSHT